LLGKAGSRDFRYAHKRLSDDVGQELVLDAGDFVLEVELLLLEALELEVIGTARFLERIDGAVEVRSLLASGTAESIAANRWPRKALG